MIYRANIFGSSFESLFTVVFILRDLHISAIRMFTKPLISAKGDLSRDMASAF